MCSSTRGVVMSIAPASTGSCPPRCPVTASTTRRRCPSVRNAASDVVPSRNRPSTPAATRWSTSRSSESTSTSPSGSSGVQTGGITPVSGAGSDMVLLVPGGPYGRVRWYDGSWSESYTSLPEES